MGRIHRQRSFISILRHASCRADDPFKREAGAALGVDGDFALRIPAQYGVALICIKKQDFARTGCDLPTFLYQRK
jgi:hypothetical protein